MNPKVSRVLTGLVAAVAFNWLSAAFPVAAPTAIVFSFVALVLLAAMDAPSLREEGWAANLRDREGIGLARFALACVLVGATVASLWLLPVAEAAAWSVRLRILEDYGVPDGIVFNFEVGAASVLGGLALIATLRGARAAHLVIFVLGTTCGMALALTSLRSDQLFGVTWLSWALVIGSLVALVKAMPDVRGDFSGFFNVGGRSGQVEASEEAPPRAAAAVGRAQPADPPESRRV